MSHLHISEEKGIQKNLQKIASESIKIKCYLSCFTDK